MSPCTLDQNRRGESIDELKSILSAYGIALAQPTEGLNISSIGVPEARRALRQLRDEGMPKLLFARGATILMVAVLFILSLVSETSGVPFSDALGPFVVASSQPIFEAIYTIFAGYALVPFTMLVISIVFLYYDYYLLASSVRARTVFPWDWIILSLAVVILGGFTFGFVLETILLQIMLTSLDASGPYMLLLYGFGLIAISLPFTLKALPTRYIHWRYPEHYTLDKKVKALRECIQYSGSKSSVPAASPDDIIQSAYRRVLTGVVSRSLFGAFILIGILSFVWFQIGQFVLIDLGIQGILGATALGISVLQFWMLKKALLVDNSDLESAAGSSLIFTYFIAIPFSYVSSGLPISIVLIVFGLLASMVLLREGSGLSRASPAVLGYSYYKSVLDKSDEDGCWSFVSGTLKGLRNLLNADYIKLVD
jgi:hypothetical protein